MTSDKLVTRTFVLEAPRALVLRDETLDLATLGACEFAATTEASVISPGTEVAAYVGAPPLRPGPAYPRVVGYCNVARVVATGADISRARIGDRVLTFQSHRSAFKADEGMIVAVVPERVAARDAAATYLFHLGYNALLKGGGVAGSTVAVLGLGTLGLTTTAFAAASGCHAIAIGDHASSRERALRAGARSVHAKKDVDEAIQDARRFGAGAGIDLVVTTSNSWEDWDLALRLPRKEGTIAVLGFPGRGLPPPTRNPLASEHFYDNQLRLVACGYSPDADVAPHDIRFTNKRNCQHLLDLIARSVLDPRLVVTDERPARELADVYERLARRESDLVTCALDWTEGVA
jgi:2-desacetyl-2-hydroxyethyl bacteriochlorophyllide A dehydrogenase